eukprot:sb/3466161/
MNGIAGKSRDSSELQKGSGHGRKLNQEAITNKPKMVIILTQSRHGSTFLLDVVSYPDTSIPVFEPLNTDFLKMYSTDPEVRSEVKDTKYISREKNGDWRTNILTELCRCTFGGAGLLKVVGPEKGQVWQGGIPGFGYKSKYLKVKIKQNDERNKCRNVRESYIVAKTIRLYNITELAGLPSLGCNDFSVIHLVRDPRAVIYSRMTTFHELYDGNHILGPRKLGPISNWESEEIQTAASHLCSTQLDTWRMGSTAPWLEGRYKLVRYEDFTKNPEKWSSDIMHWLGRSYSKELEEHIYNRTHVSHDRVQNVGNFGVDRDTGNMVEKWRVKMLEYQVKAVEDACGEFMSSMGYT